MFGEGASGAGAPGSAGRRASPEAAAGGAAGPGARRAAAAALALAACACGYAFSQRYVAQGGADRIHVRPFRNLSTEPELGAAVTEALRSELARRGSDASEGAAAVLEGTADASEPSPTTGAARTWRVAVEVRARLSGSGSPQERSVRREADYVAGGDPLETEGRRSLALRRAAEEAARDLLRALERR